MAAPAVQWWRLTTLAFWYSYSYSYLPRNEPPFSDADAASHRMHSFSVLSFAYDPAGMLELPMSKCLQALGRIGICRHGALVLVLLYQRYCTGEWSALAGIRFFENALARRTFHSDGAGQRHGRSWAGGLDGLDDSLPNKLAHCLRRPARRMP